MKQLSELLTTIVLVVPWLCGIVFAHGFWSTLVACVFPPYAWYLVAEHFLK